MVILSRSLTRGGCSPSQLRRHIYLMKNWLKMTEVMSRRHLLLMRKGIQLSALRFKGLGEAAEGRIQLHARLLSSLLGSLMEVC